MRERGQTEITLPALAGGFWGGEFSTGEVGNFQPALTGTGIVQKCGCQPELSAPPVDQLPKWFSNKDSLKARQLST